MVRIILKVLYKHRFMLIMYLLIFGVLLVIGTSTSSTVAIDENSYYKIGIVDRSDGSDGGLVEYLKANFKTGEVKDDLNLIKDMIISYSYDYILVIDKDNMLTSYVLEDSFSKAVIDMNINEYINTKKSLEFIGAEGTLEEVNNILSEKVTIDYTAIKTDDKQMYRKINSFYRGSTYTVMAIIFLGISMSYNSFKKEKMVRRLSVSGMPLSKINRMLFTALMVVLFIFWVFLVILSIALFRENVLNNTGYMLMLNLLVFMIPVAAFGFLITSITKTMNGAYAAANVVTLGFCFISGVFVSREYLPEMLVKFSSLMPPYWFVVANEEVSMGGDLNKVFGYYGILLLMAVSFMGLRTIIEKRKVMSN